MQFGVPPERDGIAEFPDLGIEVLREMDKPDVKRFSRNGLDIRADIHPRKPRREIRNGSDQPPGLGGYRPEQPFPAAQAPEMRTQSPASRGTVADQ